MYHSMLVPDTLGGGIKERGMKDECLEQHLVNAIFLSSAGPPWRKGNYVLELC